MFILLVLMVRNESRILERCLASAVPFVDAVLVADTGSTDSTVAIAKAFDGKPLKVVENTWQNFGVNRTQSLEAAREYASSLGWGLDLTYALVLDADMCLKGSPEGLRTRLQENPSGALLLQKSDIVYFNTRLMRLSDPWFCEGVTHEYWTGETSHVPLFEEAWIDDVGDGGCKADKFERDERLLLAGLQEKPCARYMFYLAQTYHCTNRHAEAIEWYQKRIQEGGWNEELWYSHFMIACNLLKLGRDEEAELYVQQAHRILPERVEALVVLVTHLREKGHHFKAWHYLQMAEAQTKPSVGLFLDPSAYGHKLDYERSILHYYVKADRNEGAMLCLTYEGPNQTLTNLEHYAQKIPHLSKSRLCFPCPSGFVSSSAAIQGDLLCVRCVSYLIAPDGSYLMPSGLVETRNFLATWHGDSWSDWTELLVGESPLRQDIIRGLEDIRLYDNDFTATTREYSYCDRNRIVHGTIEDDRVHFVAVKPPFGETECEKNWLPISGGKVIYSWHPLHIGAVYNGKLEIALSYDTPRWFRHLRGSAPPFEMDGQLWVLTHVVVPTSPRQYYHVWVVLDENYKPVKHSAPFYFHHKGIEYCLGTAVTDDVVQMFVSIWDRETWLYEISKDHLRRSLVSIPETS